MNTVMASLAFCGAWGALLGLVYFGGLWLTVRRLPASSRPHLLWVGSYAVRMTLLLAGVWPLLQQARETPLAPFAGVAGIFLMRLVLSRLLGPGRAQEKADA